MCWMPDDVRTGLRVFRLPGSFALFSLTLSAPQTILHAQFKTHARVGVAIRPEAKAIKGKPVTWKGSPALSRNCRSV